MKTPAIHISAEKEEIAKTVLMPGDPLRAKFIAETYLEDYKLVNEVRGMLGYTGFYKGRQITVMGSGMGMASIGIYSYELYKFYDVDNIIRIGSTGSYTDKANVRDIILVKDAYTTSTYGVVQNGDLKDIKTSSEEINEIIIKTAKEKKINLIVGKIYSSDVFYTEKFDYKEFYQKTNCLGVEMESFALFHNAKVLKKKAACLLTVSDSFVTKEELSAEERQKSLLEMIELALESAIKL